jgi:hypothetical protein
MRNVVLVLTLCVCSSGFAGAQSFDPTTEAIVTLGRHRFGPAVVEVRRGIRVTFHNVDPSEVLTVVAADGSFESRKSSVRPVA